jgi:hypothetical protein
MTKRNNPYLRKREYLGDKVVYYNLKYGGKTVYILMKWISGEYRIRGARETPYFSEEGIKHENKQFPYRRTVKTIDEIESLLKEESEKDLECEICGSNVHKSLQIFEDGCTCCKGFCEECE